MTIKNQAAYEAGRDRAIKRNASKTRAEKWFTAYSDAQELSDWLMGSGEFADKLFTKDPADQEAYETQLAEIWKQANEEGHDCYHEVDELERRFDVSMKHNPLCVGMFGGDFGGILLNIRDYLLEMGGLSPKQTSIVRDALARKRQWVAQGDTVRAERREAALASEWVGEIKQRMVFTLNVKKVLSFEGVWGMTYINLCEDLDGNQIVCKGTKRLPEGTHKVKATVKAHDTRDGVKQTMINRPVVEE